MKNNKVLILIEDFIHARKFSILQERISIKNVIKREDYFPNQVWNVVFFETEKKIDDLFDDV